MPAGVTIKHKRKAGPFVDGELAAGEKGLDITNDVWYFSSDGATVISMSAGDVVEMTVAEILALPAAVDSVDDDILLIAQDVIRVSGAGSAAANGDYTLRGQSNGKNYYNKIGQPSNPFTASVSPSGGLWYIYEVISSAFYRSTNNPETPDLVTAWNNTGLGINGILPVPTVTAVRVLFRVPRSVLLAGFGVWGSISGAIADQTDLTGALDAKLGSDYAGTFDMINADGTQFRSNGDGAFVGKPDAHIDASSGVLRLVGSSVELNGLPVTIGDNDSGGSGYRALVVPNA